ncbi:MAG: gamma-glutamyl-gamma-aminobutyrate hydrolase family protein [Kiritimatiellia bacterium]|nr:gamma-glutamyl-gamma-aminobutyrate hydrolase family protein [Kiritimatiellia bacterium]
MNRAIIGINTDFGDSLYRVLSAYVDCVIAAGGLPLLVPCNVNRRLLDEYIKMADGFVFIGGHDYPPGWYGKKPHPKSILFHPRRAEVDLYLARSVLRRKMPVLGICGGSQLINIALGGKIIQHIPNTADHQPAKQKKRRGEVIKHAVEITSGRILRGLFGKKKIIVNSYHHQAVALEALGRGLKAVAFANGGIVEAIEANELQFILGLQWHPERMPWRAHASKVFNALVKAAGKKS